jgi:hypothetical protein
MLLRNVNHKIPLIDSDVRDICYMPHCPDVLRSIFFSKPKMYKVAKWWYFKNVRQAPSMIVLTKQKKDPGNICAVIDLCKHNDNTWRSVTPLPDQDHIQMDVA